MYRYRTSHRCRQTWYNMSKRNNLLFAISFIGLCSSSMTMFAFHFLIDPELSPPISSSASMEPHWRYSDPLHAEKCLENHLQRGLNFQTCYSPCRIASWIYNGGIFRLKYKEDCYQAGTPPVKLLNVSSQASQLNERDTIYINFLKLDHFVKDFLPNIHVDVILLAGQQQITPAPLQSNLMQKILDHEHVLHFFIHNLEMFGGDYKTHPKMSPLPFGLKQGGLYNVNTLDEYRKAFLDNLRPNRTDLLYLSYLNKKTSDSRNNVPAAKKRVPMPEFLDGIAHAKYILSPNGMKPECYRHYEAIGLGTVPITEMNPIFAWHLKGSVIYNNTNWEIDYLQDTLPKYKISANRNMIFEEYWIEYMEKEVKRGPLIWWDRHAHRRSPLDQFITNFTEPYVDDDTFGTDDESSDSSE